MTKLAVNPKLYTQGLDLDPEMEKYVQELMASDPIEAAYWEERQAANEEFEQLQELYQKCGSPVPVDPPKLLKRGRPKGSKNKPKIKNELKAFLERPRPRTKESILRGLLDSVTRLE